MTRRIQKSPTYTLYLAAIGCPTKNVPVANSEQAQNAFNMYRSIYDFGGSAMKRGCGDIRDENGALIARISYNGRVWDAEGKPTDGLTGQQWLASCAEVGELILTSASDRLLR
jgi:hypothetical protein